MPYYPPPEKQNAEHPPQRRNILRRMVLCVSILLIVYGVVRLVGYGTDLVFSRKTTQALRETVAETNGSFSSEIRETASPALQATSSPAPVEKDQTKGSDAFEKLPVVTYPNGNNLVARIRNLRKKNKYIIGWITMDDLDEPVMRRDNDFYMNHDAAGRRNSNGAIFIDQGINLLSRPYTILLYGHNMKTGAMFGNLRRYEEFSYCYRHRKIQFDTLYEEGQYVIFAVSRINLTTGTSKYVSLSDLQSADRKTRLSALNALMKCSMHEVMADVNEEDQLLLLVTCVGDDDERLIVAARRIREEERAVSL